MGSRIYLSDVSPWWTMEKQLAALAEVLSGATVFRDDLDRRQKRGHSAKDLPKRAAMLRVTTRPVVGETIYVASAAVLRGPRMTFWRCWRRPRRAARL
jgi:hypothetical protein